MRLAFLSDVHANLPALEAVMDDIARIGVDATYGLGDLVGYAPWPNEVLQRLQEASIPVVMGNYDEGTGFDLAECGCAYTDPAERMLGDRSFAWTKAATSDAHKRWLQGLPREIRLDSEQERLLLVHGSPRRINEYLYEDKPEATFARIAAGANADWIVFGHTHRPYLKTVGSTTFLNVGSAGKPKDGDPRACWALLDTSSGEASFHRVAYDVERAAAAIASAGLPEEFATQLREARGNRTAAA
jgi:putative phosphoesterase